MINKFTKCSSTSPLVPSPSPRKYPYVAAVALVICLVTFVSMSEVAAITQKSYNQAYFILWFAHCMYMILIPLQIIYMYWYYDYKLQPFYNFISESLSNLNGVDRIHIYFRITLLALGIAIPAYTWYLGVAYTSISNVTALYNTSPFFALIFSVLFNIPGEQFHKRNVLSVFICFIGVIIITFMPFIMDSAITTESYSLHNTSVPQWVGDIMALISGMSYGCYEASYKQYAVPTTGPSISISIFITGSIGVMTFLVLWIPFPILHILGIEQFIWPTWHQLTYLIINGTLGVLYNVSFMVLIAFTTPVMAAVSLMLTIPCVAIVEISLGIVDSIPVPTVIGSCCICIAFLVLVSGYHIHHNDNIQHNVSDNITFIG